MKLETICKKCGRKIEPIIQNHVYNGHVGIMNGTESIRNGTELIMTGKEKHINDYSCPYCGYYHKTGLAKDKN